MKLLLVLFFFSVAESLVKPVINRPICDNRRHKHFPQTQMGPGSDNDKGYGLLGSLSRQGPVPVFIRIFQPDTYEAAVKKYMLRDKCSRIEAQANMDAYFQDPNGWLAERARSEKQGRKLDYVNVNQDPREKLLTIVWTALLGYLLWRTYSVQILGITPNGFF